jgi:hypothetical protein
VADSGACAPSWGGSATVDDSALAVQLADLRAAGGSVTVASGGASGEYLENACSDADSLAAAYARVLDANGSDHLEVDVEQAIPTATVIDALARLQHERGTAITLTLPVASATQGLTDDAVSLLHAAADRGLDTSVNAMTMNFPETGAWVDTMTTATDRVAAQVAAVWPDLDDAATRRKLGLTFMDRPQRHRAGDHARRRHGAGGLRRERRCRVDRVLVARPRQRWLPGRPDGATDLQRHRPGRIRVHPRRHHGRLTRRRGTRAFAPDPRLRRPP